MKNIGMLAAGFATAGWLAACSAPAPSTEDRAGAKKTRDIELIQSPETQAPSVSDLEAGRLPKPHQNRIERRLADEPVPPAAVEPAPDQPLAAPTAATEAAPAAGAAVAIAAPQEEVVEIKDRGVLMSIPTPGDDSPGLGSGFMPRRPGVIIRGGRGGIDDDCDLDRPGAHGHPMAINRVSPTPGDQFGSGTSRVGGRSGGMSGFPRGGIR